VIELPLNQMDFKKFTENFALITATGLNKKLQRTITYVERSALVLQQNGN
jgi:hypothetical protein